MEDRVNPFLTTPVAIMLGAFVISVAILVHGGVIKVGRPTTQPAQPAAQQPAQAQPQPQGQKTEADIIKNLKSQASSLGLDQGKFDKCLDSGEKAPLVQADLDDGSKAGVNGTPAFFINGRLLAGAVPFPQFKTILDEEVNGTAAANTQRVTVEKGDLPISGNENAKVTLIEFSDYQCPFCARFFTQTEGQLKSEYIDTGKVKFYYRDFPLPQIHPGAQKAAEAARCAGDQNKYWQYHDSLFQNQQTIF